MDMLESRGRLGSKLRRRSWAGEEEQRSSHTDGVT